MKFPTFFCFLCSLPTAPPNRKGPTYQPDMCLAQWPHKHALGPKATSSGDRQQRHPQSRPVPWLRHPPAGWLCTEHEPEPLVSSDDLNRADCARVLRARQEGGLWTPSAVLDTATALCDQSSLMMPCWGEATQGSNLPEPLTARPLPRPAGTRTSTHFISGVFPLCHSTRSGTEHHTCGRRSSGHGALETDPGKAGPPGAQLEGSRPCLQDAARLPGRPLPEPRLLSLKEAAPALKQLP